MSITHEHILAALAIALAAFLLGKHRAPAAPAGADGNVGTPAEWWTYAGAWGA